MPGVMFYKKQDGTLVPIATGLKGDTGATGPTGPAWSASEIEAIVDARLDARKTSFRPETYSHQFQGTTWKEVNAEWTNIGTAFTFTPPYNGVILVVGTCDIKDMGLSSGDPEVRLQNAGGITGWNSYDGWVATESGGSTTGATVAITARGSVSANTQVSITGQHHSTSSNTTGMEFRNFYIRVLYAPDVTGYV